MKKTIKLALAGGLALALLLGSAGCGQSAKPFDDPFLTVTAATAKPKAEISSELFGVFLEDINFASYALDDDLVANGGFESKKAPASRWKGQIAVQEEGGAAPTSPRYARVTAVSGASLVNEGYEAVPMAAEKGVDYLFSAFILADDYEGKIGVSLKKGSETVAQKEIAVSKSDDWVKYTAKLTAESSASGLSLALTFGAGGSLGVDGVSLETTDATVGFKNYMYEAIEDLSPRFVRFPGGCVIEGMGTDASYYDWKNSIGAYADPATGKDVVSALEYEVVAEDGARTRAETYGEASLRKPNTDIWQKGAGSKDYTMEYGVGFYEYFMLCESLKASPIPILNCGYSCMIQTGAVGAANALSGRHGNGIADFLQDAKDLVCFANGSASSSDENEAYWANVRAKMGHPEPFGMKYLGVGNEQWGAYYTEYYEKFVEAFREAVKTNPLYGGVQLIVGNGTAFGNCEGAPGSLNSANNAARAYLASGKIGKVSEYGIVDHHYYMNYTDFFQHTDFYDNYSRDEQSGYKVFLGEYSANQARSLGGIDFPFERNNWLTALSEAAYMTGLERNGDVVILAAYAPMFGTIDDANNQWPADMMFFDSTRLVRTPNYYVQQIFAQNCGTHSLTTISKYKTGVESRYTVPGASSGSSSVEKLYTVVTFDENTGDYIVKIVNASAESLKVNVTLRDATVQSVADLILLKGNSQNDVNTLENEAIKPQTSTLSGVSAEFGYESPAYSVSVIRLHTTVNK